MRVGLQCQQCGTTYFVDQYRVSRSKFCSFRCHGAFSRGNGDSLRYGGSGKTYVKLNGRHMHRVIAEQKIGRDLVHGEVVHHINGDLRDNRPENLEVTTRSRHIQIHRPELQAARREKRGY
jgi:hypothetical protein